MDADPEKDRWTLVINWEILNWLGYIYVSVLKNPPGICHNLLIGLKKRKHFVFISFC